MSRYHVFISACRGIAADTENTVKLRDLLDGAGLSHVAALGCYCGVKEASFMVECATRYIVYQLHELVTEFKQECILVIDTLSNKYQFLNFTDDLSEQWNAPWGDGYMRELPQAPIGDHTVIGGHYYQLTPVYYD